MDIFGLDFSLFEFILIGTLFLFLVYQLYFYLRYIYGVLRQQKKVEMQEVTFLDNQPPVSVIICARNEEDNLREYLPTVLEQQYPDYEVIVINDSSSDESETLLHELKGKYSHLKTTFVPVGAKNVSTKKLGLTLGIKAAKNDILIFTDADCIPQNNLWIAHMVRNFTPDTEFVLGYGAYFQEKKLLNKFIVFDVLFIALQYMGMALAQMPYMGVGRNMAYRKETFFRNKGFASSLHLQSGDDDLIVNKVGNGNNTRVEVSADSVTWSKPETSFHDWYYQKLRHLSVSSYYTQKSKIQLFLEPLTRGLFYITFILLLCVAIWAIKAVAVVLFLIRFAFQAIIISKSAKHFNQSISVCVIPLFDIFLPLVNLYILVFRKPFIRNEFVNWK